MQMKLILKSYSHNSWKYSKTSGSSWKRLYRVRIFYTFPHNVVMYEVNG